jgi:hypothetical protein
VRIVTDSETRPIVGERIVTVGDAPMTGAAPARPLVSLASNWFRLHLAPVADD